MCAVAYADLDSYFVKPLKRFQSILKDLPGRDFFVSKFSLFKVKKKRILLIFLFCEYSIHSSSIHTQSPSWEIYPSRVIRADPQFLSVPEKRIGFRFSLERLPCEKKRGKGDKKPVATSCMFEYFL